jgi:hypothetical protein
METLKEQIAELKLKFYQDRQDMMAEVALDNFAAALLAVLASSLPVQEMPLVNHICDGCGYKFASCCDKPGCYQEKQNASDLAIYQSSLAAAGAREATLKWSLAGSEGENTALKDIAQGLKQDNAALSKQEGR